MPLPGLMLQMDGSPHRWFGDEKSCLIAIIDGATSDIHAQFFPLETTEGCMKVMRAYIEKRGIFKTLYVVRAGIFGGPKRSNFSQMQRACDELGIEIIFPNSLNGRDESNEPSTASKTALSPNFASITSLTWRAQTDTSKRSYTAPIYQCHWP